MYQTLKTQYDLAELFYLQGPHATTPPHTHTHLGNPYEELEIVPCQVPVIVGYHTVATLGIVEYQFINTFTFAYATEYLF